MLRKGNEELKVEVTLEQIITGEGAGDVVKFLDELVREYTYNIAVIGPQNVGKSTLLKVLASIEAEGLEVSWTENSVDEVLKTDATTIAIGEIVQESDYKKIAEQGEYKRVFAGYHFPNPMRMPRQIEKVLRTADNNEETRVAELARGLTEFIIQMGFCNGKRVIESITQVFGNSGRAYSCREIAYYDAYAQKYIVDVANANESLK